MHWHHALDNPQAIASLFPGVDDLSAVDLHEIVAGREGPRLQLRFDLARVPRPLPGKWDRDANTTQVLLAAWGVEGLEWTGWGTSLPGTLTVRREGDRLQLEFSGPGCSVRFHCANLRVEGISGYVNRPGP